MYLNVIETIYNFNKRYLLFWQHTSNCRILYLTSIWICRRNFENFDHVDYKIFEFKVKEINFLALQLTRCFGFESYQLKFLALLILIFYLFILYSCVENLPKKLALWFFVLFSLSMEICQCVSRKKIYQKILE